MNEMMIATFDRILNPREPLSLPNVSVEENWTSSLGDPAGFTTYGRREISDFMHRDVDGRLRVTSRKYPPRMLYHYDSTQLFATAVMRHIDPK